LPLLVVLGISKRDKTVREVEEQRSVGKCKKVAPSARKRWWS
jgi:hypothetical protein